jgi:hypothetical protein
MEYFLWDRNWNFKYYLNKLLDFMFLKYTVKFTAYSTLLYSFGTALRLSKKHLFKSEWCWLVELLCDSPCCHRTDHHSHLFWMLERMRLWLGMWCRVERYQHFRRNLFPSSSFQTEVRGTPWHHITRDWGPNTHCHEVLKCGV